MKQEKIKNLVSKRSEDGNLIVQHANCSYFTLPFYKTPRGLSSSNDLERFIKAVESLVRKSGTYKGYIKYLIEEVGLNKCVLYSDLGDKDDITLEMHHSLFTLYDCVGITLVKFFKENRRISTFDVAKEVLEDHLNNLIPVAMVSKMVHKAAHPGTNNIDPIFIPLESMWGNIMGYIEKYKGCFSPENIARLRRYVSDYEQKMAKKSDVFNINLKSWKESGLIEH